LDILLYRELTVLPLKTVYSIPLHATETQYVEVMGKNGVLRFLVAGARGLNAYI
jgi:hypothetical protein